LEISKKELFNDVGSSGLICIFIGRKSFARGDEKRIGPATSD
jgi:hypothetical protein